MERAEIVTVCGSMRFFERMLKIAALETEKGVIVLLPFCVVSPKNQSNDLKKKLDELHLKKIDLAHNRIIVVTDNTFYVGKSTMSEINYADSRRLFIQFYTGGDDI